MPTGRGVDVQHLVLSEGVAVFLAPLLILGCKRLFGQSTDTFTLQESDHKVHLFLAIVRPGKGITTLYCHTRIVIMKTFDLKEEINLSLRRVLFF